MAVLSETDHAAFDLICACDGADIVEINEAGRALLGYTGTGSPVGAPFSQFVASKEQKKLAKSLASLTKTKKPKRLMLAGIDGRKWAADVKALPFKTRKAIPRTLIIAHSADPDAVAAGPRNPRDRRYRDLVGASTDSFCILRKGNIAFINTAGLNKLGDDGGKMIGLPFLHFVHPAFKEAVGEDGAGLLQADSETDGQLVIKIVSQAGQVFDVEVRTWIFGSEGEDVIAIELRDVTRRIQAAHAVLESEERLKNVVDAVADAVISIDERGIVKSFNAAAESLFKRQRGQALGTAFEKFVPDWTGRAASGKTPKPALGPSTVEVPADVLGKPREVEAACDGGALFPAEITVTSLQQGSDSLFTAVVRDITERKEAEQAQKLYAARLEEEVEARTAELRKLSRQTRQILEAANEGIIGISPDGKITMANPTAAEILDRDLGALKTMTIEGAFIVGTGTPNAGEPLDIRPQLAKGPYYITREARLAKGDGMSFEAEYAIAPIREKGASRDMCSLCAM